jgi:ATP-binding cassette subfamily B protein
MPLPAILFFKYGHYVILEKISIKNNEINILIIDPSFGRVTLSKQSLIEKWYSGNSGIAIIANPSANFLKISLPQKEKIKNSYIKKSIIIILNKKRSKLLLIFLLTVAALATNWGIPLLLKESIDKGILNKDLDIVWVILLAQFLFIFGNLIANSISEIMSTKISLDVNIDLKHLFFKKIFNLPIGFYERKFKSDLIEGLNDHNRINSFISKHIIELIITILNLFVFSVILILYNVQIFLIFILFSLITIIITLLFLKKKKFIDYSLFNLESQNRNIIYELIMGITEIKVNSAENFKINNWKMSEERLKKIKIKDSYVSFYMFNSSSFISKFRDIFLIGLCSYFVIKENMTLGTMMMISYVLGQLSAPVNDIIDFSQTFQKLKLAFDRLTDVYEKEEEIQISTKNNLNFTNTQNIKFKNVYFKYNTTDDSYILKNINITIPKNSTTAIVGASGSGKSTLMKLILGFYFPTEGSINIDDTNIKTINLKEWRENCGVIMQDGFVFSGTVAENISLSDDITNFEKLEYSLKIAELEETVKKLPLNYNTQIGESGVSLSGGEKQRLFIARAIYKNPDFIFFDEATSNLDTINENKIMNNLENYLQNKTAIIIAHRLSTVKNADNIIVLKNGEIVEQGNHNQLVKNKAEYFNLVKNQLELGN